MKIDEIILNAERNVRLTAWIQAVDGEYGKIHKRPAMVILPGGGYSMCSDREAEPVAFAYVKAGYQVFILRYSVGAHKTWPNPLNDYEQAMELIISKAEEWHVLTDKIAVIGFSAGGHLAACAATLAEHRPGAAILGYAALKKEISDMCQPGMPYPVETVDGKTCPCFLFAARDDNMVTIDNTVDFQKALTENGISFESHIYAYGQHGFSTGEENLNAAKLCSRTPNWVRDSVEWLGDVFGVLTPNGMDQPAKEIKINGDHDPQLSVDCTIGYLRSQGAQAQAVLAEVFAKLDAVMAAFNTTGTGLPSTAFKSFRLWELLAVLQMPEDEIKKLDAALREIPGSCA